MSVRNNSPVRDVATTSAAAKSPATDRIVPLDGPDGGLGSTRNSFVRDLIAGGMSGIIAKTIGAPIDRVKLLMQTQRINSGLSVKYRNPVDCVLRVYRDQGLLSFWRGNLANVYRYFPSQAMNFAFKDKYRDYFSTLILLDGSASSTAAQVRSDNKYRRMLVSLLSGGLAGATALCVSYPFDVARTRLAVDVGTSSGGKSANTSTSAGTGTARQYGGTFDCLRSTYQLEGIRGVYAGFGVSLAGVILFRALYLGGYDITKDHFDIEHASLTTRFIAAQVVTTLVGTFCFPIDTVKRRLMVQRKIIEKATTSTTATTASVSKATASVIASASSSIAHTAHIAASTAAPQLQHLVPYKSGLDCVKRILAEEGIRGLFAGLSVNLVRSFSGAILLVAYDDLKQRL